MAVTERELMGILNIGLDSSIRGKGISLHAAMLEAEYDRLRNAFGPADLVPLLTAQPELIDHWQNWCEDKRTHCGYGFSAATCEVYLDRPTTIRYGSPAETVAAYIVAELDFWSQIDKERAAKTTEEVP